MLHALTRDIPASIGRCALTFLEREPIDQRRAVAQHEAYRRRLAEAGADVIRLPADDALPDCCFVEDTALVLDELVVIASMGADTRRAETAAIEEAIAPYRRVTRVEPPATFDGGDLLHVGDTIFAGRSLRTNASGIAALARLVAPVGYRVVPVGLGDCLHLKSAVTAIADRMLLLNPAWVEPAVFRDYDLVTVSPDEPWAANTVRVGPVVWMHQGFPRTIERVAGRGVRVEALDVSEFLKAEAGLTCLSLLFEDGP